MKKPKILVVGSFVMDQISTTAVFPKQGETVQGISFRTAPGGKGANQAVQAARLGADVTMVGKLGRDANGIVLKETCDQAGICTDYILYDETEASGCGNVIIEVAKGEQAKNRILVLLGANMTIKPEEVAFLDGMIEEFDLVILQMEIPMEINVCVAQMAYKHGVKVMLNTAPYAPLPDELLKCLTFVSPNEHEMSAMTGIAIERNEDGIDLDSVKKACKAVREKGVKNVLVTLGESGAALDCEDGFFLAPCATGVTAVDPTAAGDSFVGAFCTGICSGWEIGDILTFANHTAAITVSHMGAMPSLPSLSDVENYMESKGLTAPDTAGLK